MEYSAPLPHSLISITSLSRRRNRALRRLQEVPPCMTLHIYSKSSKCDCNLQLPKKKQASLSSPSSKQSKSSTSKTSVKSLILEMSERETRDFMSVDSFSQLPFIRPAPATAARDKPVAAIRLFGIEVLHQNDAPNSAASNSAAESGRKFECHYCFRNFPTSQALGGHQNAHKRERHHAKRAHLQSAIAAHHYVAYNRQCSPPSAAAARFAFDPSPPSQYPSWSRNPNPSTGRPSFYGGLGSVSQPISGSPLPGFWMRPNRDMSLPNSLSGGESSRVLVGGGGRGGPPSASQINRVICTEARASVKDNVSLDLHL